MVRTGQGKKSWREDWVQERGRDGSRVLPNPMALPCPINLHGPYVGKIADTALSRPIGISEAQYREQTFHNSKETLKAVLVA